MFCKSLLFILLILLIPYPLSPSSTLRGASSRPSGAQVRYGLLLDSERKLDFVLGLTSSKLMERRLQTKVAEILRSHFLPRCCRKARLIWTVYSPAGRFDTILLFVSSKFWAFRKFSTI